jgi:hypothetical protein
VRACVGVRGACALRMMATKYAANLSQRHCWCGVVMMAVLVVVCLRYGVLLCDGVGAFVWCAVCWRVLAFQRACLDELLVCQFELSVGVSPHTRAGVHAHAHVLSTATAHLATALPPGACGPGRGVLPRVAGAGWSAPAHLLLRGMVS